MFNFNNQTSSWCYLLFLSVFFIFGSLYLQMVPPFQSPDEQDHLKRAYMLSKGEIAMVNVEGESTGAYIDKGLLSYMNAYLTIPSSSYQKLNAEIVDSTAIINWTGERALSICPGVNYYFPLVYAPQAFGLMVGQALDLSVHNSYYLARIFNLVTITLILGAILILLSPSLPLLGFLLIPLVLFQSSTTTQDGLAIALVIFAISAFKKLMRDETINKNIFYTLIVSLFVIITSRINLLPLLLIPFLISYRFKHRWLWLCSIVLLSVVIAWLIYALLTTIDNRVERDVSTSQLLFHYITQPWDILILTIKSVFHNQLGGFYLKSFVGILGWLDTPLPNGAIITIWLCMVTLVVISISMPLIKNNKVESISLLIIAIASFFLTFFLLLITWTPHPANLIQGVQGRYLWFPFILIVMATCSSFSEISFNKKIIAAVILIVLVAINTSVVTKTLIERYYLTNLSLINSPILKSNKKEFTNESVVFSKLISSVETVGGFIDTIMINEQAVVIRGWGLFSSEEKEFAVINSVEESFMAKTIVREDVVKAMKNPDLYLSGFELTFNMTEAEFLSFLKINPCIVTIDKKYGLHKLLPGNPSLSYQCN